MTPSNAILRLSLTVFLGATACGSVEEGQDHEVLLTEEGRNEDAGRIDGFPTGSAGASMHAAQLLSGFNWGSTHDELGWCYYFGICENVTLRTPYTCLPAKIRLSKVDRFTGVVHTKTLPMSASLYVKVVDTGVYDIPPISDVTCNYRVSANNLPAGWMNIGLLFDCPYDGEKEIWGSWQSVELVANQYRHPSWEITNFHEAKEFHRYVHQVCGLGNLP